MASMRDIKRRKGSIQSTQQITKAMKLVATVKLQRAKLRAENLKEYFDSMYETVQSILARADGINHRFLQPGESEQKAVILITGNRGLAGGYNSNVIKLITAGELKKEQTEIIPVGKKGKETLLRRGYKMRADYSDYIEEPTYEDAKEICDYVLEAFTNGEIGEIYLAYTAFKNTVSHEPKLIKLLPVEGDKGSQSDESGSKAEAKAMMNFEPADEEALDLLIPKYMTSLIYGGMAESVASENGARMQAMDSATSNAEEMIDELTLLYNRARQGSITQELTEIIAGAEAIS